VSESAVSAKRGWGSFGAKPAQSETPVRAAAKRRPPGRGSSGEKMAQPSVSETMVVRFWGPASLGAVRRHVCRYLFAEKR
jgi:hypothetical protein